MCLSQPYQEIDVTAFGFVQIIKKVHQHFYLAYRNRTSKEKTNCAKQKRFLMCVSYFVNDFVQEIRMLWYMELKCSLSE